ncbi:MAG: hypothetical protein F9K45_10010, partial [Melioribacteraceae bacterium]
MKKNNTLKLLWAVVLLLPVAISAQKNFNIEFEVVPGEKLTIDLETGASIIIEGWDKNIVKAVAEVRGRDADETEFEFDKTSSGIEITSDYNGWDDNYSSRAELKVMVPNKYDVDFKTMGGDVEIYKLEGRLEGTTMGGALILKNLKGYLDMHT